MFRDYVLEKLPFKVDLIQTDNGPEFQAGFHVHVFDRGIRHVYIKPATPRLDGGVCEHHVGVAKGWPDSGQVYRGVLRWICRPALSCAIACTGRTALT